MSKRPILLYLVTLFTINTYSQSVNLDSLELVIKNTKESEQKVDDLNQLVGAYTFINPKKGSEFAIEAIKISKKINYDKGLANAYLNQSNNLAQMGIIDSSILIIKKSIKLFEKLNDSVSVMGCYQTVGVNYGRSGQIELALEHLYKSLEFSEKLKDSIAICRISNNIGMSYFTIRDLDNAEKYFNKGMELSKKLNSKKGMAHSYNNLGMIYGEKGDLDKASEYFKKNLEISKEINNESDMISSYINLGHIVRMLGNHQEAINYYKGAFELCEKMGNYPALLASYNGVGMVYEDIENYNEAILYYNKSIEKALEIKYFRDLEQAYELISGAYAKIGNYELAYDNHLKFTSLKDSIFSQKSSDQIQELEKKYQTDKKEKEIELLNKEKELSKLEIKRKNIISFSTAGALILILIFSIIIYKRLLITKKQKIIIEDTNEELNQTNEELAAQRDEIEKQKEVVEEQRDDIVASINYAKRIQNAILPAQSVIKEHLPESFVLYKPKDVVAGDFYWIEKVDNTVFFAAADCTGHGVPGAMVSVVCHNAMNRAVREFGLTEPGLILDKTREIVIHEFEKSEDDVKDGMDIALCSLSGNKLKYAGAHNPLWIIRNDEILETKANKQPIGKFDNIKPFTTHTIDLQKGDKIYVFSDGYIDQFGGEKDKKFGSKHFKELLFSIQEKSMTEQKEILDITFKNWMNESNAEQVDDVCVMGIKN